MKNFIIGFLFGMALSLVASKFNPDLHRHETDKKINGGIMKKVIAGLFVFLVLSGQAQASIYVGKLDLGSADPSAIVIRDLYDGLWLVGAQQQVWHLQNTQTNQEVIHVSGFWANRLEGQDTAYGPSVGVNFGEGVQTALGMLAPELQRLYQALPPIYQQINDWISLEAYVGYRPFTSYDDRHFVYGFGGKLKIPVSEIYTWAKGVQKN